MIMMGTIEVMVMITKEMMMVMIKVMVLTTLTSLQCLGSAFLPNTGVEARTKQRGLNWTCRQPDKSCNTCKTTSTVAIASSVQVQFSWEQVRHRGFSSNYVTCFSDIWWTTTSIATSREHD